VERRGAPTWTTNMSSDSMMATTPLPMVVDGGPDRPLKLLGRQPLAARLAQLGQGRDLEVAAAVVPSTPA